MPIFARDKSKWNAHLKENHAFWEPKCQSWVYALEQAFENRNVSLCFLSLDTPFLYSSPQNLSLSKDEDARFYQDIIDVLREMRQVGSSIHQQAEWQAAVKVSWL